MATQPLTRPERQAQTRAALLESAREAFLEHGYDGVSLADIARAAGCTTGAVYANFGGKDDLFLAVLNERSTTSVQAHAEIVGADLPLDDALRSIARFLIGEFGDDLRWGALMAEYWARAARNPEFRAAAIRRHESILTPTAELVEKLAHRHGMRLTIPAREVVRGAGAMSRGVRLERTIGIGDGAPVETFEEMFLAYTRGLLRPAGPGDD